MTKKQTLRAAAFIAAALLVFMFLCSVFETEASPITERYEQFKDFESGTIDGIYIGSSAVDRYWIAAKAFEDTGMAVYPLSSDRLPAWLYKNMALEAYSRQNAQLYIIDLRSFTIDYQAESYEHSDSASRRVIDMLGTFSGNRTDAIKRTVSVMSELYPEKVTENDLSYWVSLVRFHNRWQDGTISLDDVFEPKSETLGYFDTFPRIVTKCTLPESSYSDVPAPIDELCEYYLDELLDFFDENGLDAVFVDSPRNITADIDARCKGLFRILDERGYPYITYNTPEMQEAYPFDLTGDFYNYSHTNFWGAEKYTDYFSQYLLEHYDLPDHRGDDRYADWVGVYDSLKELVEENTSENNG